MEAIARHCFCIGLRRSDAGNGYPRRLARQQHGARLPTRSRHGGEMNWRILGSVALAAIAGCGGEDDATEPPPPPTVHVVSVSPAAVTINQAGATQQMT